MQAIIIPVTSFAQNATLFYCEKSREAVAIDPGGDVEKIIDQIESNQLELVKILLTHGHADHIGGVSALSKYKTVPIIGPNIDDKFLLDSLALQCQMFGLPQASSFMPDCWLTHGDHVTFGEVDLQVIHCPGHTPGHVVFYQKDHGIAQVGDVLFKGSIGRTDLPRGDYDQLISSIKERLFSLPDDTVFIPGHGPTSTIGEEKTSNPFVRMT